METTVYVPGRRRRRVALRVLLVALALPMPLGLLTSKLYWGHWAGRPRVRALAAAPASIERIGALRNGDFYKGPAGSMSTVFLPVESIPITVSDALADAEYPHYFLEARLLKEWSDRSLAGNAAPLTQADAAAVDAVLARVLTRPSKGYSSTRPVVQGIAAAVTAGDGRSLIVAGLRQEPVSNDHWVYHEVVIDPGARGGPAVVGHTRFCFDVAGIEGATWLGFAVLLGVPVVGLAMLPIGALLIAAEVEVRRERRQGRCGACGYDLRGHAPGGVVCPECGTGRAAGGGPL